MSERGHRREADVYHKACNARNAVNPSSQLTQMVTQGKMDVRLVNLAMVPTQQTLGSTNRESSPTEPCPMTHDKCQGKEQPAASALHAAVTVTAND